MLWQCMRAKSSPMKWNKILNKLIHNGLRMSRPHVWDIKVHVANMGPTYLPQVGPMLATWILLYGIGYHLLWVNCLIWWFVCRHSLLCNIVSHWFVLWGDTTLSVPYYCCQVYTPKVMFGVPSRGLSLIRVNTNWQADNYTGDSIPVKQ